MGCASNTSRTIEITCQGARYQDIFELTEFQGSLKELTEERALKLRRSILKYGFSFPVFVWDHNKILDGHQRIHVTRRLIEEGYTLHKNQIPVVDIDAKTEREAKEKLLMLVNQYARVSEDGLYHYLETAHIDFNEIKDELEIPDFNLEDFQLNYFEDPPLETDGDDEIPEEVQSITQPGDLWELNGHRLLCGDSAVQADIERLIDGLTIDMIFTDPPYGMNLDTDFTSMSEYSRSSFKAEGKKYKPVIGDDGDFDPGFMLQYFKKVKEIFLWGADYYADKLINRKKGSWFVWDKKKGLEAVNFSLAEFELCWSKNKHARKILRYQWFGACGMQHEKGEINNKRVHPNQKPTEMIVWFLHEFSRKESIIWDGYLGSGSTIIACEKTGRRCLGIEIDPDYCDVIVERYRRFCDRNGIPISIKRNGEPV